MSETLFFIDAGFLSKLNKHLSKEKYFKFDIVNFCKKFSIKENLEINKVFINYYNLYLLGFKVPKKKLARYPIWITNGF